MKTVKSEHVVFFDIDQTLILYKDTPGADTEPVVLVLDPIRNKRIEFKEHTAMTRLMREEYHRGAYIVVWSRGGYEWAANVIEALGLEECVQQVMSKPVAYFDDKPVAEWMNNRVYLEPGTPYKRDR